MEEAVKRFWGWQASVWEEEKVFSDRYKFNRLKMFREDINIKQEKDKKKLNP